MNTEITIFPWFLVAWFAIGIGVFVVLLLIDAPYGRHLRKGFGPFLPPRLGWVLMESPAFLSMLFFFITGNATSWVSWIFLSLWLFHYGYRTFIYPFLGTTGRPIPISIVGAGMFFNMVNGYLNGRWLFALSEPYALTWLADPRWIAGILLFVWGFIIHVRSDARLRGLRAPGETGYKIPHGGLFRLISCPNYFGEIIQWSGWAIMTWSLPTLAFTFWTTANLAPRALSHHRWYRTHFSDYPPQRKALIPYVI